jgi:acetyltransferase-like isoleucine patch superfamily enzyme
MVRTTTGHHALGSSPLNHLVRWGLQRARPGSEIDTTWPTGALLASTATWGAALVRGLLTLSTIPGSRLRVCEAGVTVHGRRWCRFGRWLLLERGVTIRARGGDGIDLDDYVVVGTYSTLEVSSGLATNGGSIRVGTRSSFGDYCYVGGAGGVVIGRDVLIGQNVSFHSQNHVISDSSQPIRTQGVTSSGIRVGDDCWIGAGARILDGVVVGDGSVIGAGAVVTKSVPAGSVVTGVPGRVVNSRLAGGHQR